MDVPKARPRRPARREMPERDLGPCGRFEGWVWSIGEDRVVVRVWPLACAWLVCGSHEFLWVGRWEADMSEGGRTPEGFEDVIRNESIAASLGKNRDGSRSSELCYLVLQVQIEQWLHS